MELSKNTTFTSEFGVKIVIDKLLGEGGQGYVYKVDYNGVPKALKIYKPNALKDPKAFYLNLKNNVTQGSPSTSFLWMEDTIPPRRTSAGITYGYIMDLRPNEYKELSHFLCAAEHFANWRVLANAAMQITTAFRILHSRGCSYQDLNDGNFFIHPQTGTVMICDNDNVAPNGEHTGILGKSRYMAPEIVRGETMPNTNTDRFSLAIILFLMFTNTHPLEGRRFINIPCMTPADERELYGDNPLYILDPNDTSNCCIRGTHRNIGRIWPEMPQYIRKAFETSFTIGLKDPNRRLTEQNWMELLMRFQSELAVCSCGNDMLGVTQIDPICPECGRKISAPAKLKTGYCDYEILASEGALVYRGQFSAAKVEDAGTPLIGIVRDRGDNTLWMHNISSTDFSCITPSGKSVSLLKGKTAPLKHGLTVNYAGGSLVVK